jgi:hypothetical protein
MFWWGLRVSNDGEKAGFPIYVCGGSHEDVPLTADAGRVPADAIVDRGLSMVLSIRHLSKTDQRRFVEDFCDRLYDRKADPKHRTHSSVQIYDFLDESILLDQDSLADGASAVSDKRLRTELEAYRSHVLRNLGEIRESLRARSGGPKAFVNQRNRSLVKRARCVRFPSDARDRNGGHRARINLAEARNEALRQLS